MSDLTLDLSGIAKAYNKGKENEVTVLRDIDLAVKAGEIVALVAPSGAGK
jgi:lipoprotein-releasing system ATP-binding protein